MYFQKSSQVHFILKSQARYIYLFSKVIEKYIENTIKKYMKKNMEPLPIFILLVCALLKWLLYKQGEYIFNYSIWWVRQKLLVFLLQFQPF